MKTAKQKKHKPGEAELRNDPSLRFCPYRKWETVWSDAHNVEVRFMAYVGDQVQVADLVMAPLPGYVPILSIRRPSTMTFDESEWKPVRIRTADGIAWFSVNRALNERVACKDQSEAELESIKRNGMA